MDRGIWQATLHGVTRDGHDLVTKAPPAENIEHLSNFTFTFPFHALEKAMATHSSVLAWRIPRTEEPGGLQAMGLQLDTAEVTQHRGQQGSQCKYHKTSE